MMPSDPEGFIQQVWEALGHSPDSVLYPATILHEIQALRERPDVRSGCRGKVKGLAEGQRFPPGSGTFTVVTVEVDGGTLPGYHAKVQIVPR